MRNLILERIQQLREHFSDFSPRKSMRWGGFRHKDEHIYTVDFEAIEDDEELLKLFERIVRQCSKMM